MNSTCAIPDALVAALRDARHACVLTGAGVSAESGVPTFRDAQRGLWAKYDPQQLATTEAFVDNPRLVWEWYRWRREIVARVEPNPGHRALAALERRVPAFTLITQNVDGLHQRAGSGNVIEFHGNLFADLCLAECSVIDSTDAADVPLCPACGELVRPGVVWFGEAIPEAAMNAAFAAAADCDVFLSIGTSSTVYPAAGLVDIARDHGATTAEINPRPTVDAAQFDYVLTGPSGVILPKLLESLHHRQSRKKTEST